jgi:adenine-specific DNA methylase
LRCTSCNKFTGIDAEVEPEVDDVSAEVEEGKSAIANATIRIQNNCEECGETVQEATLEVTNVRVEVQHTAECDEEESPTFSAEVEDLERIEKFEPPKAKRQRRFFGASGTIRVTCDTCGAEGMAEFAEYVQSSHMDSTQ